MTREQQITILEKGFIKIAAEAVVTEIISGAIYVLGSMQACQRIHQAYSNVGEKNIGFGWSENLGSWFFRLD